MRLWVKVPSVEAVLEAYALVHPALPLFVSSLERERVAQRDRVVRRTRESSFETPTT